MLKHEDITIQFMEGFWQRALCPSPESASHARSFVGNMPCFQEHTSSFLEEKSNVQMMVAEGRPQDPVPDKVIYDASPLLISTRWQIQEELYWVSTEAALRDHIDSHNILLMFASYVLILYTAEQLTAAEIYIANQSCVLSSERKAGRWQEIKNRSMKFNYIAKNFAHHTHSVT